MLESHRPGHADASFNATAYGLIVRAAWVVAQADAGLGKLGGKYLAAADPGALLDQLGRPELVEEPFDEVALMQQGRARALVIPESRTRRGGPAPDHDSYSIPVFTKEDRSAELIAEFVRLGKPGNIGVGQEHRGSAQPSNPSLMERLRRLL